METPVFVQGNSDGTPINAVTKKLVRLAFVHEFSAVHKLIPQEFHLEYDKEKKFYRLNRLVPRDPANPTPADPLVPDPLSIVIGLGSKTQLRYTSYAVNFVGGSERNESGFIERREPARGYLRAIREALSIVEEMARKDKTVRNVYFAFDFPLILHVMTVWLEKWVQDGGVMNGKPVRWYAELHALHQKIRLLERDVTLRMKIRFWGVPWEHPANLGADDEARLPFLTNDYYPERLKQ